MTVGRRLAVLVLAAASLAIPRAASSAPASYAPVTDARLAAAARDDGWLMYRRSYDSQAYAPFTEITPRTVRRLSVAFTYDTTGTSSPRSTSERRRSSKPSATSAYSPRGSLLIASIL